MTQSIVPFIIDTINVNGQPTGVPSVENRLVDFEVTQAGVDYYNARINEMKVAYQKHLDQTETTADTQSFINAINSLNAWAKLKSINMTNNQTVTRFNTKSPPSAPVNNAYDPALDTSIATGMISGILTTTMDRSMAQALENINRLLGSSVVLEQKYSTDNFNPGTTLVGNVLKFGDALFHLTDRLDAALNATATTRIVGVSTSGAQSIQEILMVDYVSLGNQLIFDEMSKLREAINNNQGALGFLNSLQDLMNQKNPTAFQLKLQNLLSNLSTSGGTAHDTFEKDTFDQILGTAANFSGSPPLPSATPGVTQLYSDILSNSPLAPRDRVISKISITIGQVAGVGGAENLLSTLNIIKTDLQGAPNLETYVQDFSGGATQDFQRHINDAITASQSFNDTQREELQRVMFVYEEFYKSSTGLLSRLTQLIEKIASYINR
jgi:hypothetical protein